MFIYVLFCFLSYNFFLVIKLVMSIQVDDFEVEANIIKGHDLQNQKNIWREQKYIIAFKKSSANASALITTNAFFQ
jgi:hypothetical protein